MLWQRCGTNLFVMKIIFQVALLTIFVYFFGIPSVERFIRKEVLTVITETYPEMILPPAVTIIAFNGSDDGWEALEKVCGDSIGFRSCIQENTFSLPETVHAELGFNLRESLMASELWREDFTFTGPMFGRFYTLEYPHLRGSNWRTDDINLHVNVSDDLTRRIFIHDPNYFVINMDPLAIPMKRILLTRRSGRLYYSLSVREHRKLKLVVTNPATTGSIW